MSRSGHYLKIFESIIDRIFVYVVDYFISFKNSTKMFFHNQSVFKNTPPFISKWVGWNKPSESSVYFSKTAIPIEMLLGSLRLDYFASASNRTKLLFKFYESFWLPVYRFFTEKTINFCRFIKNSTPAFYSTNRSFCIANMRGRSFYGFLTNSALNNHQIIIPLGA